MAGSVTKLIGQTIINNIPQAIPIIAEAVQNVVINTTVIQDSPLIAGMKVKLETIQEGAQVNPDLTSITEAITTKADNQEVATAFSSINQTLQNKANTAEVNSAIQSTNSAIGSVSNEVNTHKQNAENPHSTTKEQVGIRIKPPYTLIFNDEKTKTQLFDVGYFTKKPEVKITLESESSVPPHKENVTKDGVTIIFSKKYKGQVTLEVTEI